MRHSRQRPWRISGPSKCTVSCSCNVVGVVVVVDDDEDVIVVGIVEDQWTIQVLHCKLFF